MNEKEENEFLVVLDTFYNTLEPLEEYIGKTNHYPNWDDKRQFYRKSIADSNDTVEGFEDLFLTQLFLTTVSIKTKSEPFRKKIQEEYYKWINATKIEANNCPKKLKHYLFEINEILEGRWDNFVKQNKEEVARIEKEEPIDLRDPENREALRNIFSGVQKELNHPPERKKIDIKGDAKAGEEVIQQISREIADEQQNFRFFPQKQEQQTKENTVKSQPSTNQNNNKDNFSITAIVLSIFLLSSLVLIGYLFWREREREWGDEKHKIKIE